jgi:hypothetical protein
VFYCRGRKDYPSTSRLCDHPTSRLSPDTFRFTGASFDQEAIRAKKETAVFDKPYIKKSAWVGAEDFPEGFTESIRSFSRREFQAFETREEGLTWLAKD